MFNDYKLCTYQKHLAQHAFVGVVAVFIFPFQSGGEINSFELCQSRSRHYHVVTANVHGKDLYGRTNLKIWT